MIAPRHIPTSLDVDWDDWQVTEPLSPSAYRDLVAQMGLRGCKWDLQVGDTAALTPFALTISRATYATLGALAERLTEELDAMETALAATPHLWPALGLPSKLLRLLGGDAPWTPSAARVIRYDFHPTLEGWRISEANSDVPGGFNEASTFSALFASRTSGVDCAADPLAELTDALAAAMLDAPGIALIAAPGYREDLQVVSGLSSALHARGIATVSIKPEQLRWDNGRAYAQLGATRCDFGAIYRFFQGEWSTRFDSPDWRYVFRGGLTPVCNPGTALLTESKRLPLIWNELPVDVRLWRDLLPATVAPWRAAFGSSRWVHKSAYCNNGEAVVSPAWGSRTAWLGALSRTMTRPHSFVAQHRFDALRIATPNGPMYPCIGIYTIDGRATGIYARLSPHPVVDYAAQDVPVLLRR